MKETTLTVYDKSGMHAAFVRAVVIPTKKLYFFLPLIENRKDARRHIELYNIEKNGGDYFLFNRAALYEHGGKLVFVPYDFDTPQETIDTVIELYGMLTYAADY